MGTVFAVLIATLFPQEELKPGKYRVTVRQGSFLQEATSLSDPVRKAVYGEEVDVLAFQRNGQQVWAKCKLREGATAFIMSKSILPSKDFEAQVEGSEETGAASAEGYRGSRFDPKTEEEFSKGKNLGPAYEQVNQWAGQPEAKDPKSGAVMKQAMPGKPAWRNSRKDMLAVLRAFRREGKLGEFTETSR